VAHDKREDWIMQMHAPLPGQAKKKPSPTTEQIEGQGFMELMAKMQAAN
jgi:hypothetical protein